MICNHVLVLLGKRVGSRRTKQASGLANEAAPHFLHLSFLGRSSPPFGLREQIVRMGDNVFQRGVA